MEKIKLKNNFVAAIIILLGGYNSWVAVLLAFWILAVSEDEWLKKTMTRLLIVVAIVFGVNICLSILENECVLKGVNDYV